MKDKDTIRAYFAAIAQRYDLMNHVLSFGQDWLWRRRVARLAPIEEGQRVLDVCTGTCDLILAFERCYSTGHYVGVDLTEDMLVLGQAKTERAGMQSRLELHCGDAEDLPYESGSFDVVTMGFGLRNLPHPMTGIQEIYRVLKPGGKALILEFAPAPRGLFGWIYRFYLTRIIPVLGGLVSGSRRAYQYLASSVQGFFVPEQLQGHLREQGFTDVKAIPLSGRIAYIYVGTKEVSG